MLYKPIIGGEMSGSMGAITASHNKGGTYFRNRVIPVNPSTVQQGVVRTILGTLASAWTTVLTQVQRDAWATYALNVPLLNRLGDSRTVTALNMYQRSNVPRIQNGLPRVDDGPTLFNLGDFTPPTITSFTAPTALALAFNTFDDWNNEDDAAMLIYGARDTGIGINYFTGPYRRYAIQALGDFAIPPGSPFAGVHPFPITAGNQAFIKVSVTRVDGRLSLIQRLSAVAV